MSTPDPYLLYVWEEFSLDYFYYHGLAFAIAPDLDTARDLVLLKLFRLPSSLSKLKGLKSKDIVWGPVTIHPLTETVSYFHLGEDL
jgi:hypothetical protein